MEGKTLARIGAVAFVAVAITVTVVEMTRKDDPAPTSTATTSSITFRSPAWVLPASMI